MTVTTNPIVAGGNVASGALRLSTSDGSAQYRTIAGVMRNFNDGNGWRVIIAPETPAHAALNVGTITTSAGSIAIDLSALGATNVVSFVAAPDETMIRAGFTVGSSVTTSTATVFIQQQHNVADYISWNGSAFTSASGVFTIGSYSSGILSLTHANTPINSNGYLVSVTPRDETVDAVAGSANATSCQVKFIDRATNTLLTVANSNCKAYVNRGFSTSGTQTDVDPTTVHEGTYPGANIWFYGIFKVN